MNENEMISKASRHFTGYCERNGYIPTQPSASSSEVDGRTVVLRNVGGELATYRIDRAGRARLAIFGSSEER